jgi:hypothetical protein
MADTLRQNPADTDGTPQDGPIMLAPDQLDYMADLIAEFRVMSDRSGLTTLAGILSLAQVEAALQLQKLRKKG